MRESDFGSYEYQFDGEFSPERTERARYMLDLEKQGLKDNGSIAGYLPLSLDGMRRIMATGNIQSGSAQSPNYSEALRADEYYFYSLTRHTLHPQEGKVFASNDKGKRVTINAEDYPLLAAKLDATRLDQRDALLDHLGITTTTDGDIYLLSAEILVTEDDLSYYENDPRLPFLGRGVPSEQLDYFISDAKKHRGFVVAVKQEVLSDFLESALHNNRLTPKASPRVLRYTDLTGLEALGNREKAYLNALKHKLKR